MAEYVCLKGQKIFFTVQKKRLLKHGISAMKKPDDHLDDITDMVASRKKPYKILPCPWCEFRGIKLSLDAGRNYQIQCSSCERLLLSPTKPDAGLVRKAVQVWNNAVKTA